MLVGLCYVRSGWWTKKLKNRDKILRMVNAQYKWMRFFIHANKKRKNRVNILRMGKAHPPLKGFLSINNKRLNFFVKFGGFMQLLFLFKVYKFFSHVWPFWVTFRMFESAPSLWIGPGARKIARVSVGQKNLVLIIIKFRNFHQISPNNS